MAESPVGYLPDVSVKFSPQFDTEFETEIEVDPHSREEQRRARSVSTGQRMWSAETISLEPTDRRLLYDFLKARRGQLQSFYFFDPAPQEVFLASLGSVSAQSVFVAPFKCVSASGAVVGSWSDIRVAGVTKAFTVRRLVPRTGTYSALRFPGSSTGYVNCGSNAMLRPTGNQSLSAWVFRGSGGGATQIIAASKSTGTAGILFYLASGVPRFGTLSGGVLSELVANFTVADSTWTHIAVVLNAGTATWYLNGAARNSGAVAAPGVSAEVFAIGSQTSGNTYGGLISDLRFYDTNLSASDVSTIYSGGIVASSNLRGWWKLDEGTGNPSDYSGYANNGTLTGTSPTWVAGEDEITFTGGAQTGAVTGIGTARPRVIARSLRDSVGQVFVRDATGVYASFPIDIMELPS